MAANATDYNLCGHRFDSFADFRDFYHEPLKTFEPKKRWCEYGFSELGQEIS